MLCGFENTSVSLHCYDNGALRDTNLVDVTPIDEGEWIQWGVYVKINTAGVANGIASLYKNGTRVLHSAAVEHRAVGDPGFNYFWLGGNYSNSGSAPATDGEIYYDDIKVYSGLPY
jgi:hypothetical protein